MLPIYNPSTHDTETGGIDCVSELHGKLEDSLGYMRPCCKQKLSKDNKSHVCRLYFMEINFLTSFPNHMLSLLNEFEENDKRVGSKLGSGP